MPVQPIDATHALKVECQDGTEKSDIYIQLSAFEAAKVQVHYLELVFRSIAHDFTELA